MPTDSVTPTDSPTPTDSAAPDALPAAAAVTGSASSTPTPCASSTPAKPQPPKLTLTASARNVGYQARVTVTARLGGTDPGAPVSIYARVITSRTSKLIKKGAVEGSNGKGDLAITVEPAYSTVYTAVFAGDARYAPATVTTTVSVAARVTESQAGYYKSVRYAGTEYRVYHAAAKLRDTATVAPNKHGECVEFELQISFQGAWHDDLPSGETTTRCGYLSRSSTVLGEFTLAHGVGARYRLRALYAHSRADSSNLNSDSPWVYFEVTR
ncbi:MAG TPA: hypothetical protein VHZ03_09615 [Trebonia sp.]|jgi:hypothetical protein|nr:hypothetical protein [Trebonia sp.]